MHFIWRMGFGLFFFAVALFLGVIAWRIMKAGKENVRLFAASAAWPTVPGRIGLVTIDEQRTATGGDYRTFHPKIDYAYTVADREHAGTRIDFTGQCFASDEDARAAIANYAAGAAVMIAYDPADPQNSVLDRTAEPPSIPFATIFMFAVAAGCEAVLVSLFLPRHR